MPAEALARAQPPRGTSVHAFAGGMIEMVQPSGGRHRAGLEAALLGAALDPGFAGTVVDLGAGVGAAGLTIAARCPRARVMLVDVDPVALDCAAATLARPGNADFAGRVEIVHVDIASAESVRARAGLQRARADLVIANPPFREGARSFASPQPERSLAHVLGEGGLEPWARCAASILRPGGAAVFVVSVAVGVELANSLANRFGGLDVLPIHPRATMPASRVLVRACKDSRAPLRLLPPLVLHGPAGSDYLPEVEDVLRGRRGLADVHAGW